MTGPQTRALVQAGRLENLAAHLRAHPYLATVNPMWGNHLQLETSANPARELVSWASTMTGPLRVQGRSQEDGVYVVITGRVGDRVELAWDTLRGFAEYLADIEASAPGPELADLDLELLRSFADATDRARRWVAGLDAAEVTG